MNIKKKWRGSGHYRYKDNPLEKAFAEAWQQENDRPNNGSGTLDYLVDPGAAGMGMRPMPATEEQRELSCIIIQWLGSPVWQCFLEKVLHTAAGRVFLREKVGGER